MTLAIQRIATFIGLGELSFDLPSNDRTRLVYASVLPGICAVAFAVQIGVRISNDRPNIILDDWPYRIYNAASAVETATIPLSIAALFLLSVSRPSRPLGSWAAVIAAGFFIIALASVCFIVYVVLSTRVGNFDVSNPIAVNEAFASVVSRHYLDLARTVLSMSSFLAIGYAFLAYRGLSWPDNE